jgi:membrane protein DedA with SNARE-associated domain
MMRRGEPLDQLAERVVGHVARAFFRHVPIRLTARLRRMSQQIIQIISAGGLLAIFLTMAAESAGIPISSEIVVPLGGALASQGKLSFVGVVIAASAGNLLGSLVAYLLVKRYGETLILGPGRRVGLTAGHLRLANRFFERWGLAAVFTGRLLPVIRTYISFPAGLSRITVVPFTVATVLGAIPWNLALAYAGFKLGQNYERVASVLGPFTIPIAIIVLLAIVVAYYYGRRIGEAEAG